MQNRRVSVSLSRWVEWLGDLPAVVLVVRLLSGLEKKSENTCLNEVVNTFVVEVVEVFVAVEVVVIVAGIEEEDLLEEEEDLLEEEEDLQEEEENLKEEEEEDQLEAQ